MTRSLMGIITIFFVISFFVITQAAIATDVETTGGMDNTMNQSQNGIGEFVHAPLNPEFIKSQPGDTDRRATLSGVDDKYPLNQIQNRYQIYYNQMGVTPTSVDLSHLKGQQVVPVKPTSPYSILSDPIYPSLFDLRTSGKVTGVRDQSYAGSCWAFASYGSLESNLLPVEEWDFSENNMKNLLSRDYPEGFDRNHDAGGNYLISTAYLARWDGPVKERDDPYNPGSGMSPLDAKVQKHIQNVLFLPGRANSSDNNNIKWALSNYGGIYSSFLVNWNDFNSDRNETTYYYHEGDRVDGGHAITIVGWNDSFSKYSFVPPYPMGDGAFICKNSWGSEFGEDGYFYISYYDPNIGGNNALFTGEMLSDYSSSYEYDPFGWTDSGGFRSGTPDSAWFANNFTATQLENLTAVSFYTGAVNSAYDLYVYTGSGLAHHQSGVIDVPGYHTISFSPGLPLTTGERFQVRVHLTTPQYNYPIPLESRVGGSSKATAHTGESFISQDGVSWMDVTTWVDPNTNVCLKAFTTKTSENASITIFSTPPDADIVLDGKFVDTTPTTLTNLSAGTHSFTLMKDGYRQNSTSLVLTTGYNAPLHLVLSPSPIQASFIVRPDPGAVPRTFIFNDTSNGDIIAWQWNFGDGNTSTQRHPVYTYVSDGRYRVILKVSTGLDNTSYSMQVPVNFNLAQAVDNTGLLWDTEGNAPWFVDSATGVYGGSAARSGVIGNNQYSTISTMVTGPGVLDFSWKVSSESNFDYLVFFVDDTVRSNICGDISWRNESFVIGSGTHKLSWIYDKDSSVSLGADAGWLDYVRWKTGSGKVYYVPDNFTHIQDAINAADVGSTIIVRTGGYPENPEINKPVILRGEGSGSEKPVIIGNLTDDTVTINADNVVFEGFMVTGSVLQRKSDWSNPYAGIRVIGGSDIRLLNNTISGGYSEGILVQDWYSCRNGNYSLIRNTVSENQYGIIIDGNCGIDRYNLDGNIITNNSRTGLLIYDDGITMRGNEMRDNQYNIGIWPSRLNPKNTIDTSNTVNGKPVIYLESTVGTTIDASSDAGAVYCVNCSDITVKDLNLTHNDASIAFFGTRNSTIQNCTVTENYMGIIVESGSTGIALSGNHARNNNYGIIIWYVDQIRMRQNQMNDNPTNFEMFPGNPNPLNDIDTSNTVDGKPIIYLEGATGRVIDPSSNAGVVYCVDCSNVTVKNLDLANNRFSIGMFHSSDSSVIACNLTENDVGILLYNSSVISIQDNYMSHNSEGIGIEDSRDIQVTGNTAFNNEEGIGLFYSGNTLIEHNNISSNYLGTIGYGASDTRLIENIMRNSDTGIVLLGSSRTLVTKNSIGGGYRPVLIDGVTNSAIYLNDFMDEPFRIGDPASGDFNISAYHEYLTTRGYESLQNMTTGPESFKKSIYTRHSIDSGSLTSQSPWQQVPAYPDVDSPVPIVTMGEESSNIWHTPEPVLYSYNSQIWNNYLGNHWQNYYDTDNNDDGIWDTPYIINYENIDSYSLREPVSNYIQSSGAIQVRSGWNFVSTPRKLGRDSMNASVIFSTVNTAGHSIYRYNASDGQWYVIRANDEVVPLEGYWIYSKQNIIIPLTFDEDTPLQLPPTRQLYSGWNAMGFSDVAPATAHDTLLSIDPAWTTLLGFDTATGRYESSIIRGGSGSHSDTRLLYPGRGYWVYITNPVELSAISI